MPSSTTASMAAKARLEEKKNSRRKRNQTTSRASRMPPPRKDAASRRHAPRVRPDPPEDQGAEPSPVGRGGGLHTAPPQTAARRLNPAAACSAHPHPTAG